MDVAMDEDLPWSSDSELTYMTGDEKAEVEDTETFDEARDLHDEGEIDTNIPNQPQSSIIGQPQDLTHRDHDNQHSSHLEGGITVSKSSKREQRRSARNQNITDEHERLYHDVFLLRHKLQRGFWLNDDSAGESKEDEEDEELEDDEAEWEEMESMRELFEELEALEGIDADIIQRTKIHKVLKAIGKINLIPKDNQYRFKQRSLRLIQECTRILETGEITENIAIDFYGDFRLIAGQGMTKKVFTVSKTTLCLASSVWFTMLNPFSHFIEGRADEVKLRDDDPAALAIILRIAHLKFDDLPKTMEFDMLRQLAILCDKYDMRRLLEPFLPAWVNPYKYRIFNARYEDWLTIAWAFGYADIFGHLVDHLVTNTCVNKERQLTNKYRVLLKEDLGIGIIDRITSVRLKFITIILSESYAPIKDIATIKCYGKKEDKKNCEALILGSLISGLNQHGLWPLRTAPGATMIKYSPKRLLRNILKARSQARVWVGHTKCQETAINDRFATWQQGKKGGFFYVEEKLAPIMTDAHLRHFGLEPQDYEALFNEAAATVGFLPKDLPDIGGVDPDTDDENYVPRLAADDLDDVSEESDENSSDTSDSDSDTDMAEDEEVDV